ncbi:glycerophosphodiester phosphodiesterase [Phascolarctobacterium succinatutens]|uniref:glycerophosphodiester phosphodiesterase n=1 Tax=Phascolarctobacterium succinatutens TaxID=626940 RepID=UPI00307DE77B
MVQIFAHRGFSGYYPENTMLAFKKVAEETVADGIELDIQLTKDGEIVIMHDEMLDRTTNGSGWLKDHTLEELKMLSVGVNVKGFFPRQTIPTLREYFTWLKTTKLITNIELKTSYFEYEGIEEKLIAMVKEFGLEDQIWYSSFNHYTVARIKKLMPEAKCGLLTDTWLMNIGEYAASQGAASVNARTYFCAKEGVAADLHAHNIALQAWTPNDAEMMQELVDAGVDVLITNYPDIAAKVLGR